jgi:hypothetical protein
VCDPLRPTQKIHIPRLTLHPLNRGRHTFLVQRESTSPAWILLPTYTAAPSALVTPLYIDEAHDATLTSFSAPSFPKRASAMG